MNLCQHKRRPLFERQPVECRIESAPRFTIDHVHCGRHRIGNRVAQLSGCLRPTLQKIAAAVASNRQQPRRKLRPLWVERIEMSERRDEDLLSQVVHVRRVPNQIRHEPEHRTLMPRHQQPIRGRVPR